MQDAAALLTEICTQLAANDTERAEELVRTRYPAVLASAVQRKYSTVDLVNTALRDGFIDRYTGKQLVFPGTLRLLSVLLPEHMPYQANWAYDRCHPMYWDLCPTLDHVVPVARGGLDVEQNWVTASQRTNSAKAHWTLEELGWRLQPPGDLGAWDGLIHWFLEFTDSRAALVSEHKTLRVWRTIARRALAARPPEVQTAPSSCAEQA
jgi:hypothetical protein